MLTMKTKDAIDYYGGSAALASALGIDRSAVLHWKDTVPLLRQYQIEVLTKGALRATNPEQAEAA